MYLLIEISIIAISILFESSKHQYNRIKTVQMYFEESESKVRECTESIRLAQENCNSAKKAVKEARRNMYLANKQAREARRHLEKAKKDKKKATEIAKKTKSRMLFLFSAMAGSVFDIGKTIKTEFDNH